MNDINNILEFSQLDWYIDYFLNEHPQWMTLLKKKYVSSRVEEKPLSTDQEFDNFKQEWLNFTSQNEQLASFLKNSFIPLLTPQHPLVKIFNTVDPPTSLDFHRNRFPEKLISPRAETSWHYPRPCTITRNLILKSCPQPDVLFVVNSFPPSTPIPKIQTVLIMENKYSWFNIAPRGNIDLKKVESIQQNISLISSAINQTAEIIKSQNQEYSFKRIPLPYHPLVEEIVDRLGFPPRAGMKLKSELLTDYLIVIWSSNQ